MAELRALVVDDSKVGRLTMRKKLEAIGIQVDMVESGPEALDYLGRQRPDLIFMDHMMPEMDGFEVTRRIKATPIIQDLPVIIVSGNDEPAFVEQARAAGAIDAITKPPPPGVLEAILADLAGAASRLAAAPPPVAQPAPSTPAPTMAMDRAAVQSLVEQLLGAAVEPLREELLAEFDVRLEARLVGHRPGVDPGFETRFETRLADLETKIAAPGPDVDGLRAGLAADVASMAAELDATWRARLDELSTRVDSGLAALDARLGEGIAGLDRQREEARAELAGRCQVLEQRFAAIADASAGTDAEALLAAFDQRLSARLEETRAELLAHIRERASPPSETAREEASAEISVALADLRVEFAALRDQAESARRDQHALRADLSAQGEAVRAILEDDRDPRLDRLAEQQAKLVGDLESLAGKLDGVESVDAGEAVTEAATPSAGAPIDAGLADEIARLRARVKTLTLALAVGGGALLVAVGALFLRG